jgi:hypothetical protein
MKTLNSLLLVTLAIGVGAAPILAQHGHGAGAGHMDMPDHTSQVGAGHTAAGAGMHDSASQLTHNPALASKLQALLPAGTNIQTAANGFKNLGQFVAAVHVAHNLNIPFDQLKAKMTGPNAESLGHAIHDLEPNLSGQTVKSDVKTGEHQAKQDLEESQEASEKAGQ